MFENDYIHRQIEIISRSLAMLFLGRDLPSNIISEEAESNDGIVISEDRMLRMILKKMLYEGNINKAEEVLFDGIEDSRTPGMLNAALWFYDELNSFDDDKLEEFGFSRQEVLDGIKEVQALFIGI